MWGGAKRVNSKNPIASGTKRRRVEAGGEQDRINRIYRIGDGRVLVEGIGKMLCGLYVPCG
jgi:hypothetical protein